jgi:hypothetical protein
LRRVRVWGGTHPDEQEALRCAESLMTDPLPNVYAGIANPLARKQGRRFVDINLCGAFPGDPSSGKYEERRAAEILVQSQGYDIVVDLHNISQHGENTAWIDGRRGVNLVVLGFLASLGIRNLIVTNNIATIQMYAPNAFMLETVKNGLGGDIDKLPSAFDRLANDTLQPVNTDNFCWFAYVASLHVDQIGIGQLDARQNLQPFGIMPATVAERLATYGALHIVCWRDAPNEQGFWGEAVRPIQPPDSTHWANANTN